MLEVYAEKDVFEDIVICNEDYPNWYKIFCEHSAIYLNITDEELIAEEMEGTAIFEYIKANGGNSPIALKSYFDSIYDDNSIIALKPRSVFFLKYTKTQADTLQNDFGIIVQSEDSINDNILNAGYFRELDKEEVCEKGTQLGWHNLLSFPQLPSNALVLMDNFLFNNTEKVKGKSEIVGFHNIIQLFDAILPNNLKIDYHVTIITEDLDKPETWRNSLIGRINTEVNNLRTYKINVEVVFQKSELYHKRRLLMNYINASCDKGFSMFKVRCGKTVRTNNDIRFNTAFANIQNALGETEYSSVTKGLQIVKRETNSLAAYIQKGTAIYLGAITGGCNADKTLTNRLINEV